MIKKILPISTILRLMDYRHFRGRVGPEDRLTVEVATMLRVATIEGKLRATWTHVSNEAAGRGKFAAIYMAKARAMGLIKGSSDFVFVWDGGGGWIEMKTETGSLTKEQREFRDWVEATGGNHALCRSVEEVETVLTQWGVLVK